VKANITGNVIKAYLNDTSGQEHDGQHTRDGNPGMGFNLETGDPACIGTNSDYRFNYTVDAH
jgi:hypothetical protein